MSVCRLLYTSQALHWEDAGASGHIQALAARSEGRNRENGLTGCLVFVEGCFIQILEGPPPAVEETFERICCDFRHRDVKLIDLAPVRERYFADWGMAFLSNEEVALQASLEEIRFTVGINAREAMNQMRALFLP